MNCSIATLSPRSRIVITSCLGTHLIINYAVVRRSDLRDVNIKVRYNNIVIRLPLSDIASLTDSLLSLEDVVLNIILLMFINYLSEDLGLSTSLLEV